MSKKNKLNTILLSSILAVSLAGGGYMIYQNETSKPTNSIEDIDYSKDILANMEINRDVLNKEKILSYINNIEKNKEAISNGDESFTQSLDVQLAVKYQDAALYYKYLINPLLNSEEEVFSMSNIKFAYQNIISQTLSMEEDDFKEAVESMRLGIVEDDIKGNSIADKELLLELNDLLNKEADILLKIYENYELKNNTIVLKEGHEPLSSSLSDILEDDFYKENKLSNHFVQFTIAFDLYQNSLEFNGKTNEMFVDDLLEVLNSYAYFEYIYLDELVSNMSIDTNRDTVVLPDEDREFLLSKIELMHVYLKDVSDDNFYKKQMIRTMNNFENLIQIKDNTMKDISDWYTKQSLDIAVFSRDSVRNSFYVLSDSVENEENTDTTNNTDKKEVNTDKEDVEVINTDEKEPEASIQIEEDKIGESFDEKDIEKNVKEKKDTE